MVSAAKAFSKEPPREPLDNLRAIVEDFQWRYVDRKLTDQVIVHCKRAPTLSVAIDRAVRARDAMGKHHNHQSKVDLGARLLLGARLRAHRRQVRGFTLLQGDNRFDRLHDLIDEIKPYGIGPVTVYDVAVRVGAFLNIEPISVYMHAGVRQGMLALEKALDRTECPDDLTGCHKRKRVPIDMFPRPLNQMRADDVEDILCTYREVFESW